MVGERRFKPLTEAEVEFSFSIETEDAAIEGNAMASGDDAIDEETNDWVRREIARGNLAAWCYVVVKVEWNGYRAFDSLGCCSYRSEKELWADLRDTMKQEALDRLNESIQRSADILSERFEVVS